MWRYRLVILCLAVVANAAAAQGADEPARACRNSEPNLRIRACTAIIESREVTIPDVAEACLNRGMAYGPKLPSSCGLPAKPSSRYRVRDALMPHVVLTWAPPDIRVRPRAYFFPAAASASR